MNEMTVIRGIYLDAVRFTKRAGNNWIGQWRIILPIEGHTYSIGIHVNGVLDIL